MANKYSFDDYNNAKAVVRRGYNKDAEEVLRWYYVNNPTYIEAHLEYAKTLLFEKSGDMENDLIRKNNGFQILDRIIANPKATEKNILTAYNAKIKSYYLDDEYFDAYDLCYSLLGTSQEPYCNYFMGCIESRLGDIYSAEERFKHTDGKYYDSINQEMAVISIAKGDFEQAEKYVNKMKKAKRPNDNRIPVEEIYLNVRKGDYKNAYELYKRFKARLRYVSPSYNNLGLFLEYKLGINDLTNIGKNYLMSQVRDYNAKKTKSYIHRISDLGESKHLISGNRTFIDELFDFAQQCINDDIPFRSEIVDYYAIECYRDGMPSNIGYVKGNIPTNVIKVGALSGTKNIVSLYPMESLPYIRKIIEEKRGNERKRK